MHCHSECDPDSWAQWKLKAGKLEAAICGRLWGSHIPSGWGREQPCSFWTRKNRQAGSFPRGRGVAQRDGKLYQEKRKGCSVQMEMSEPRHRDRKVGGFLGTAGTPCCGWGRWDVGRIMTKNWRGQWAPVRENFSYKHLY